MLAFRIAARARATATLRQSVHPNAALRSPYAWPSQTIRHKSNRPITRSAPKSASSRITNPGSLQYSPGKPAAKTEKSSEATGEFNENADPSVNTTPTSPPGPGVGESSNNTITNASRQTGEFNTKATPSANTVPTGQPGPNDTAAQSQTSSRETAEFNEAASPSVNTTPDSQPGPSVGKQNPAQDTVANDFSTSQDEFSGPKTPKANTTPEGETVDFGESQAPKQPLPDLRYGIPSTFAQEYLKEASKSEAGASQEPNITDDPAQASTGAGGRGDGELPRSAYETSIDKRRNKLANYMYLFFAVAGTSGALYLGRNWESEEEAARYPNAPSGWSPGLIYNRIRARMSGQMGYYTEPTFVKLLPTMDPAPPYTLVLSLEDLMIFSEWTREHGWRTGKRPGLDYFLRYLSQYYELVLWTSMPIAYADQIVRKLDPYHIIMWPLFREATLYDGGKHVKDLSYLNRPLDKVIVMDTNLANVKNQPENAIILKPWKGDTQDKDLVSFVPFLEYIATMGITDVREALKSFDGKHIPSEYARREALLREQFNKQFAEQRAKKPRVSGVGLLNSALGLKPQGGMTMDGSSTVAEGLAEGKMLQDQIRERGMKQYQALEKEIRENGAKWLKEEAEMEKKAQAEQALSAKAWTGGMFGASKPAEPSVAK